MVVGTKAEVWHGTADKTSGGLTKDKLMKNKNGRIVSKRKHEIGMKMFKENKLQPLTKEALAEIRVGGKGGRKKRTRRGTE